MYRRLSMVIVVLFASLSCQMISPDAETEHTSDFGEYMFDTGTVLKSLARDDTSIFLPYTDDPNLLSGAPSNQTRFSFFDLLYIAKEFHQWHWKEPVDTWNLSELEYQIDCNDIESGPSFLSIELFKISDSVKSETRFVHNIMIGHPNGVVYWSEAERYPVVEIWKSIDLTKFEVSAESALSLAEENKGQFVRLGIDNNCKIQVMVAPYLSTDEWLVRYIADSPEGLQYLLEVYVHKKSGVLRVIYP